MALERNCSLQTIERLLKSRGVIYRSDYLLKRFCRKGWNITVRELLNETEDVWIATPMAEKRLDRKVQSVCMVNDCFERNSVCVDLYWMTDEDIKWAAKHGAVVIVTNREVEGAPCVVVSNPRKAFAQMCRYFRRLSKASATVVIGSIGKTTTKRMIESVYAQQFETLANPTNKNLLCHVGYDMQHAPKGVEKMIEEVSEDTPGYARYSSMACQPSTIVITSIDKSHFEAFGSQNGIAEEICSVTENMKNGGSVIVCKEDFAYPQLVKRGNIVTVSVTDATADYFATNIAVETGGGKIRYCGKTNRKCLFRTAHRYFRSA